MQVKSELRSRLLEARSRIPESLRQELSVKIAENLFLLREFKEAETIFCYVSKENEISTEKIISHCFLNGKRLAAPVCKGNEMTFRYIKDFDDLQKGSFAVYEPNSRCEEAKSDSTAVCITPALCYNENGFRIGYGKGFYDRFFEKNECVRVGLCYEEYIRNFVPDINDKAVNIIVTEDKIIRIGK